MNILQAENGRWVKIIALHGGRGMQHRLAQLGFLPGNTARVIRFAPFHGPLLIDVDGREIVLGRGIARHIMVEYT